MRKSLLFLAGILKCSSAVVLLLVFFAGVPSNLLGQEWPEDDEARYKFVEQTSDQAILVKIVLAEKKSFKVFELALEKITEPKFLADLALQTSECGIGLHAVKKLDDQALLAELAINAKKIEIECVRREAIYKMTDQKLLAKIAMSDSDQASRAIDQIKHSPMGITDPNSLIEVSLHCRNEDIRRAAIALVTDQKVLAEIALKDLAKGARVAALENLKDQKVLAEIALNDPEENTRRAALYNLTDQIALRKYLHKEGNVSNRCRALDQVEDEAILKEFALSDPSRWVRADAVERLRDQAFLKEVLKKDTEDMVRVAAFKGINDVAFLVEIAKTDTEGSMGHMALDVISDQALLVDVARNAKRSSIRLSALRRITDGMTQAQIVSTDSDPLVREEVSKWPLRVVGAIDTTGLSYIDSIQVYFVPVDENGGMILEYRDGKIDNIKARLAEEYSSAVARGNRPPIRVDFVLEVPVEKVAAGQLFTIAVGFVPPAPRSRPYGYGNPPQERVGVLKSLNGIALHTLRVEGLTRLIDIGTITIEAR